MGVVPAFASVGEAMEMARAALGYLAAADATALSAEAQAECLRGLERTDAIATAARASFLSAFTAGQGYSADADYSARAWLMHRTGITRGAAASHTAWANRAGTHPAVVAALAGGDLSESYGRGICQWTDKLPEQFRAESDELLVTAAAAGLGLADLAALFAEMYERARGDLPDEDPARGFADRGLKLVTTFQGAGVMTGDLTPECATAVAAVLDALGAPAGKDDDRTREQRYHDALAEAMRRLLAAGLLPERAGQPVKAWVHISLADLLLLDADSALQQEWTARVRAQWAARRAAVMLRDGHCQWAGRCDQPAAACQVHHTRHKAHGGTTSVKDCVLLCWFHHQVVIHRWGWTLIVNPDGTTTAWNKDKTRVLHSHGPPVRPG